MTDYLPLLSRAVTGLERNTGETRRAVYDRARTALNNQLRSMTPALSEAEITRERLALEEAIRRIEAQNGKGGAASGAPPPSARGAASPPPAAQPSAGRNAVPPPPAAASRPAPSPAPGARPAPAVSAPAPDAAIAATAAAGPILQSRDAVAEAPPPKRDFYRSSPPGGFEIEEIADAPETNRRPQPRDAAGSLGEPLQPRPYRGRGIEFARVDASKTLKAKMVVGGIVAGLIVIAALIGFFNRERIVALVSGGAPATKLAATKDETPKISDRIAPDTKTQQSRAPTPQPAAPSGPVAAVAQRAVLYEENPNAGAQQLQTFVGTAVWRTETVNPGPGRPPELGLRVDIEIPDRKMTVAMTVRRNPDKTLPASHTIEVQFTTPGDPFGGVANIPGLRAKTTETAQGVPLNGLVVRVMPGFFLIGLSAIDTDREQNLSLLRERGWLDLPFVYNNGRRAVLVMEKGTPGERAVNEAVMAWGG